MKRILFLILLFPAKGFSQMTILYDTVLVWKDTIQIKEINTSKGRMEDGLKTGIWKTWFANGQLADSGEYTIFNKNQIKLYKIDSIYSDLDTAAIRKNFAEKYSFPVGSWVWYYRNGNIQQRGSYLPYGIVYISPMTERMESDGTPKTYYSHTTPDGMRTGLWEYYDKNGRLEEQEKYINGVLVGN